MKRRRMMINLLMATAVAGAIGFAANAEGEHIELAYSLATEGQPEFEALMAQASEELGIDVEVIEDGADHEALMKTRMGSGELPDIWTTHGWSILRYGEYITDLSDQEWVDYVEDGLKSVVTTDDGEIYILPITKGSMGVLYNIDVIEAAGIDIASIHTWSDFETACDTIKSETEANPIAVTVNTSTSCGSYLLECVWPSFFTASDLTNNYGDALRAGEFDFGSDIGRESFEMIAKWYDAGYINEDCVSSTKEDMAKLVAVGDAAFIFYNTDLIPSILSYNADARIGVLPTPAYEEGGKSSIGTGEGNYSCFAISNKTENADACKALLSWMAEPEHAAIIARLDGGIPTLNNMEIDETADYAYTYNAMKVTTEQFGDMIDYDNLFDRKYLPSGMWSVMKDSMANLFADGNPSAAIDGSIEIVQDNYDDLMDN